MMKIDKNVSFSEIIWLVLMISTINRERVSFFNTF
ncbi:hypothetical protein LCGC14_0266760 [marine sediment metagenome]|uniref:Uncharacterized protein n=1 Tax=marine sediment metagenome TaxID=412755 RepID=A0A0F9X575_9ZZZZ